MNYLLLITGLLLSSYAALANDINIKANVLNKAFYKETKDSSNKDEGASSRLQIDLHFKNQDSWNIKSTVQTFYNWAGDRRHDGGAGSNYSSNESEKKNPDNFTVDKLFVEKFTKGTLFRIGRQEANWANGFNINDDRRDRLLALKPFQTKTTKYSLIGIYDLRFSNDQYNKETKVSETEVDDLHMYAIALIANKEKLSWGALYALFSGGTKNAGANKSLGYNIDQFHQISPYIRYSNNDMTIDSALTLGFSNSNEGRNGREYLWGNDNQAAYLKALYLFNDKYTIEGQVAHFNKGGYIGRGWDSFSLLYNNSSRNDASPARIHHFGGIGDDNHRGELAALRLTRKFKDLELKIAAGQINIYNEFGSSTDRLAKFSDLILDYQVDKKSNLTLRIGKSDGSKAMLTTFKVLFN